jgi:predicted HTH domain antitoxin
MISTGLPSALNPWHHSRVPDKPTSEQIRREAETLRQTAIKLIEHAAVLIEKSAQLENQVSILKRRNPTKSGKR